MTCGSIGRCPETITGAGAQAGLVHVDMRVGLVAGEHGRVLDHRGKQIGMHVERHADGQRRRELADPAQQFALSIVMRLGHHCAVQVEQSRVAALRDRIQDPPGHPLISLDLHRRARLRVARNRQNHLGPGLFCELDECADRSAGALERCADRLAFERRRAPAREAPQIGRHRREGVGFVLHLRNHESHENPQFQPERTTLPIMWPLSTRACAARRFSASIGASRSVTVARSCPPSIHPATRPSKRCCSIMSGVA